MLLNKDVENRDHWLYKHRGPLIIHASAGDFTLDDVKEMLKIAKNDGWPKEELEPFSEDNVLSGIYPQGYIVGVVRITDVYSIDQEIPANHPSAGSPWGEKDAPFWLCFADPEPCIPVECKGRVGLFKVPYEIASKLKPING